MSQPLISIVICCHNRRHLLEETMASVFAQQYSPVEIIILDDGSTDGTRELMSSYGGKVNYAWQKPQGSAAARNAACKMATGKYIAFHDDDDIMMPYRISKLYETLRAYPEAVFSTGGYEIIDSNSNKTGQTWVPKNTDGTTNPQFILNSYRAVMWATVPSNPCTILFKRSDGERINWLDTNFRFSASDKDFFGRLALLGPMVYVPEVVYQLRRGHSSIWGNDSQLRAEAGSLQLYEKHLELIGNENPEMRQRFQQKRLESLRKIASGKSRGLKTHSSEADAFISQAIFSLPLKESFLYKFYASIKLPLKKRFKKT